MAIQMTDLCGKGVALIWKQCDETKFPEGLEYLEEAARGGDPEALFFLGHCYSWGDGAVGFNDKKAYECYREGAKAGSYRCVLGALRAGQYDEELKSAAKYSLEESLKAVKEAAEEGDSFAAYQLARAFEWEEVFEFLPETERRTDRCLFWYERAAEGGIVEAMVKAGKCYLSGRYTLKNKDKAISYADKSAALGHAWGLYQMGLYYQENGSPEAAYEYFLAATAQGDKEAPYCLGRLYLYGSGVARSVEQAIASFETAAAREENRSLTELGDIYYKDEVVEREDDRAFYWYSRAYAAGDKAVALPLGHLYLRPSEIQDCQKAAKLFAEAAEEETDGFASLALGNMYRDGTGAEPDMEKALVYYEAGAEMGNAECMEILGNLYFHGDDVDLNYEKAFYWLDRCEEAGTLQSYSRLAFLYLKGFGCAVDEGRARALFEKAAETECDGYAFYELGLLSEKNGDSQEDLEKAVEYYQRAIEMGNESAERRFAHFKKNLFGKWKVTY